MCNMNGKLKEHGIRFLKGMTQEDIFKIQEIYGIILPKSLIDFYGQGIPYIDDEHNSFPNWTDYSQNNILKIKERIEAPIKWLSLAVKDGFWLPCWGSPDNKSEHFRKIAANAPKLIPIYSHRYIPMIADSDDPPVISTVGSDIIYYGSNLQEYLNNEFLNDGCLTLSNKKVYIPFWSEIIDRNSNQ